MRLTILGRRPHLLGLQMNTKDSDETFSMKIFTVDEANALLPTVRNILAKVQRAHKLLFTYKEAAKKAADGAEKGGGGISDGLRYATLLVRLTSQMAELESLGVQLKDFDEAS